MRPLCALLAAFLCLTGADLPADDFAAQRAEVLSLGSLSTPPAIHDAQGIASDGDVRAIFFEALPWRGKPTRVFAWLGLPKDPSAKVPGVVLVHGGGGTAFSEWVRKWNAQGFAAISIAVEGQTSEVAGQSANKRPIWKRHAWAGPPRVDIYGDTSQPLPEQWTYHAVADTVLANSLLRSLPEVDPERVGVMGVSWGGVVTSTVIGIDPRFAFAVPTYGCGHLFDADNQWGRALGDNAAYRQVWDPMVRMARVKMPVLWLSWPEDVHFPLDCQAACYRAAPGPHMVALVSKMGHGHQAAWNPADSYAFADSVVRDEKPWCLQTAVQAADERIEVAFAATRPLDRALLVSTTGAGYLGARQWTESPATLEKHGNEWRVMADLPSGTTGWYVNVRSGPLTASSDYQTP